MAKKSGNGLDWAGANYSVKTGRAVSSVGMRAPGSEGASGQVGAASGKGVNGAPGVSAMDRSGSADSGRNKWGGSTLP